jgi:mono/diheme cytochrome c family protein
MLKKYSLLLVVITLLVACANDYLPDKSATGQQIYKEACVSCHSGKSTDSSKYWIINKNNANKGYVIDKVKRGSLTMPSFKNINTEDLEKISKFVLEHSIIE